MLSLDSKKISSLLPDRYKGIDVFVYDSIDSTNTEAKRIFEKGKNNMLLCAEKQTAGRGRHGKSFYSPEKTGVYFSLVIKRTMALTYASRVTTAAAVAVCEAIEELTDKKPKIKWVNDIFLDGKKICGILTEAIPSEKKNSADGLITGIGINILTTDFPYEIRDIAGSLGEKTIDKNLLVSKITEKIFDFAKNLENPKIIEEYKARSLVIGRDISYETNGEKHTATAVDIDENCSLVVKLSDGKTVTLTSGEISIKAD